MKLKKGDTVFVLKGKDRGKSGKIARVFAKEGKVLIEGINIKKRHVRPRRAGTKGETVEIPHPLRAENVMLICRHCGKRTRIGSRAGEHVTSRVCKKCGGEV